MKVHGFLKSSNVVIDSRWVCKVTDFGLARFKSGQKSVTEVGADNRYRSEFSWRIIFDHTVPLRSRNLVPL